jgi:hypothetical protein
MEKNAVPMSTNDVLAATGLERYQLTALRRENPEIQPVRVIPPNVLIWAPEVVAKIREIAAKRFPRLAHKN